MDKGWIEADAVDDLFDDGVFDRHPRAFLTISLVNITNTCAASHGPVGVYCV